MTNIEFDSEWKFASDKACRREGVWPNFIAYSETKATLALIVKKSTNGEDFAVGDTGLRYLEAALKKGTRTNGTPVHNALVLLVVLDPEAKNRLHPYRVVQRWSVQEARDCIQTQYLVPKDGTHGVYYWMTPDDACVDSEDEWACVDRKSEEDA